MNMHWVVILQHRNHDQIFRRKGPKSLSGRDLMLSIN